MREEGSLDYDEGLVRLQVQLKFDANIHHEHFVSAGNPAHPRTLSSSSRVDAVTTASLPLPRAGAAHPLQQLAISGSRCKEEKGETDPGRGARSAEVEVLRCGRRRPMPLLRRAQPSCGSFFLFPYCRCGTNRGARRTTQWCQPSSAPPPTALTPWDRLHHLDAHCSGAPPPRLHHAPRDRPLLTVKIRQPSHEFTFGVGISFIPYPLVLTPVV
jgi:hypothetical protein